MFFSDYITRVWSFMAYKISPISSVNEDFVNVLSIFFNVLFEKLWLFMSSDMASRPLIYWEDLQGC